MERTGNILRAIFDSSDYIWFFINPDYKIIFFNKKAFENGKLLHGKELNSGDSLTDYARDAKGDLNKQLISTLQKVSEGNIIGNEQLVEFETTKIWTKAKYIPVFEEKVLIGISITIEDISVQKIMEENQLRYQRDIVQLSKSVKSLLM